MEYVLGVSVAVFGGLTNFLGQILQKKAINDIKNLKTDVRMADLIKNPVWLIGLVLLVLISSVCILVAQNFIGAALIPGLVASGFIVLAIGSVRILGEKLTLTEYIAMALLIAGIVLLSLSRLSIDGNLERFYNTGFVIRMAIMSAAMLLLWYGTFYGGKKSKYKTILMAFGPGCCFILGSIWTQPLAKSMVALLSGNTSSLIWIVAAVSLVIVAYTGIMGIVHAQKAFAEGNASIVIPIQQMPQQIAPIIIYFFVYRLAAPDTASYFYISFGIVLVILAGFILGRRQGKLEKKFASDQAL
jgi:multidrug transporter EmrE-like cation transporter